MTPAVGRDVIVEALRAVLEPLPYVDALVEGGAAAWGRLDAWSDIDLNVFTEDGKVGDVFPFIEGALRALSPIEHTFVAHGPSAAAGMQQKFYRLKHAGPFLLVDLAVLPRSEVEKFLEREIHGENVVYFDKVGVTKVPPLDRAAFDVRLRELLARLRDHTEMFHVFVQKEMNRGNWIEAIDNYRVYVIGPLIQLLRMKYNPVHHSFRTRYVHYEFPPEVIRRVQDLLFVRDADDLRAKYTEALRWVREVAAHLG